MVKKAGGKKKPAKAIAKAAPRTMAQVPSSFTLTVNSFRFFKQNWAILSKVMAIYLTLDVVLANGLGSVSSSLNSIKNKTTTTGALVTSGTSSQSTSFFQSLLLILGSLAVIWTVRHLMAANKISLKDAYYKSMTPLVPFVLVSLMIVIQLLPLVLGAAGLGLVLNSVFGTQSLVTVLFVILFIFLAAWSVYMITSSILALYIVTLPDMQPRQALKSAKKLVNGRRWLMVRHLLFVPLLILVVAGVFVVPLAWVWLPLATGVLYVLTVLSLLFFHTYFYSLYRSLI